MFGIDIVIVSGAPGKWEIPTGVNDKWMLIA